MSWGEPILGITSLQSWIDTITASTGFQSGIGVSKSFLLYATGAALVGVAWYFIESHFPTGEQSPTTPGDAGGRPPQRNPRRPKNVKPNRPRPWRSGDTAETVYDSQGREYQGSQRVYRERDSGAPLPTQGAFGDWLHKDRS